LGSTARTMVPDWLVFVAFGLMALYIVFRGGG
jgi:hypothetical protein